MSWCCPRCLADPCRPFEAHLTGGLLLDQLKDLISKVAPGAKIDVSVAGSQIVLRGQAPDLTVAKQIHDLSSAFGTTQNFGLGGKTPYDVIDHIFNQDDHDLGHKRSAVFIWRQANSATARCPTLFQAFAENAAKNATVVETRILNFMTRRIVSFFIKERL